MKAKRILSMALAVCLCLTMIPAMAMPTEAATPGYAVTSSYKTSSYYSALCNVTLTGNQRTDIVNIALSQVGYREGSYSGDYSGADDGSYNNYTEYNYWYHNYVSSGMPVGGDSAPWCATFVSWCAEQANIPSSILKRSTAAGHGASYFNVNFYSGSSTLASSSDNDSYFMGYNYTPQKGDLFFTRSWSHVGLVVGVSGSYVITVEGNTNNNGSSQGNGVYKLTWRKIADLYFGIPNYTNASIQHTVDTSYGTNFTAYPKAKITAENIFNAYHSQINSTSWIGTSDKCTIQEVYTDGCCKVTYPLDAGGTKTVYSKISLFITHTHSYTGSRYYESDHPHKIWQKCVDYDTCGGWIYTGEYYEKNACEQCWHADFDIGASSVSVKVGESETIAASVSGCLPDSAVLYRNFSPDNDIVEVTITNQQATFTGLKAGTTDFSLTVYSDSSMSHIIATITIPVTVTNNTYTVSYSANGGTGAPGSQTKYHGTTLYLSTTAPIKAGYKFKGWSTSSTATSATYQPGDKYSTNADVTLYAVWEKVTPYAVEFDANGGTGAPGYQKKYYDETLILSSKVPTRTGYTFLGWATSPTATNAVYQPGDEYTVNAAVILYAVWEPDTYIVMYDANGGTGGPTKQEKVHGVDLTLSSKEPTRTGYTFLGWSTSSTATSATYQPGGSFSDNADTTLYAVWKQGCENGTHSYSYTATKVPTTSATGTLTGTCSKCSGTTTVTLPKLNTTDYNYSVRTAATCTVAGSGRYTWKTTTYGSLYFDVSISATGHSYSTKVTAPTCTASGYTTHTCSCGHSYKDDYTSAAGHSYGSWKTSIVATCTEEGKQYRVCTKCKDEEEKVIAALGHNLVFNNVCDRCGYVEYTVSYNANGGTGAPGSQTKYYNETLTLSSTRPSRTGYTFLGWSTDWDSLTADYLPGDSFAVNADTTLYAVWKAYFADIVTTSWQFGAVNYAVEKNLMAGKGKDANGSIIFDPNNPISREEFVQVLYNAEGKPSVSIANKFPDVKNEWYKNAVLWAKKNDIANGTPDGNFGVGNNITRQDLSMMLYKYAKLKGCSLAAEEGKINQFADGNKVANYAKVAMDWAVTNGVLSGKGEAGKPISTFKLDPAGTATRAECAAMLKNFMDAFGL